MKIYGQVKSVVVLACMYVGSGVMFFIYGPCIGTFLLPNFNLKKTKLYKAVLNDLKPKKNKAEGFGSGGPIGLIFLA